MRFAGIWRWRLSRSEARVFVSPGIPADTDQEVRGSANPGAARAPPPVQRVAATDVRHRNHVTQRPSARRHSLLRLRIRTIQDRHQSEYSEQRLRRYVQRSWWPALGPLAPDTTATEDATDAPFP